MDVAVFLGRSLSLTAAQAVLPQATYLPPLVKGDITRILQYKPHCIAIIDGHDSANFSSGHEDIVLALQQGVQVFGAATLGARCAVHYSKQGMIGIGKMFQEYLHQIFDEEAESTRLSLEDLVNIQQTVARAHQQGIISRFFALELLLETRARCYSQSDFNVLARQIATEYGNEGADFLVWCETKGQFDQRSLDALELLDYIAVTLQKSATAQPSASSR